MKLEVLNRFFDAYAFDKLVSYVENLSKNISFSENIGNVVEVTIPAGTEIRIPHGLKVVPKYRIILRQYGNGVITDGAETWTEQYITLLNNGAVSVTLRVGILRS